MFDNDFLAHKSAQFEVQASNNSAELALEHENVRFRWNPFPLRMARSCRLTNPWGSSNRFLFVALVFDGFWILMYIWCLKLQFDPRCFCWCVINLVTSDCSKHKRLVKKHLQFFKSLCKVPEIYEDPLQIFLSSKRSKTSIFTKSRYVRTFVTICHRT